MAFEYLIFITDIIVFFFMTVSTVYLLNRCFWLGVRALLQMM